MEKRVIDISFETNPELYTDYEECIKFLRDLDDSQFEYPPEETIFHVYSEIKSEKELMVVKSYLATQNLEKTRMIVWSDYDISDNPLIQEYKDMITFNVYDAHEEAKDTLLEDHPYLSLKDEKYYLQSDLARILLLYKYGGVWVDMDIVLLRDFKPILDQEYMYMWGSETDFKNQGTCATVLSLHKESMFADKLLRQLMFTNPVPNTECWGKTMFADIYKFFKFNVFPATFFNVEWCINSKHPSFGDHIESQWFTKELENKEHLFLECFAWHWHNSSKKGDPVATGSKFDLLQKFVSKALRERGIKG
jgi:hypothetical protein